MACALPFQNLINVGLCFIFLVILRFMAAFKSSSRIGKAINSCDNDIYTSAIFLQSYCIAAHFLLTVQLI